jgi:hypothetical protein
MSFIGPVNARVQHMRDRFCIFKLFISIVLSISTTICLAGTTSTLILRGTIAEVLDVEVAPEAIATNLPLTISQTHTKVARVLENSNSSTGYKITISSANQGKLIRVSGTQQFPYSLQYDGVDLNLVNPVELIRANTETVSAQKNLTISYSGVEESSMVAGDYADTITFSISAN